jgi:hypothetical protein
MSATTRTTSPAPPARAATIRKLLFRGERPRHLSRPEKPMNNASRARQQVLAVFLPVTAALYVGAEALDPRGTDQVATNTATAFKLLPTAPGS